MNRSIFQIWHQINLIKIFIVKQLYNFLYSILISFIILYTINFDFCDCFSLKGISNPLLKELHYKDSIFMYSKNLSESNVINAVDLAVTNENHDNFNIIKYFELKNNVPVVFSKNTCYSHPNLFFGVYNNLSFNLQFSHSKVNPYFKFFTNKDIINFKKIQFICNQIYIYDGYLNKQYLNWNNLNNNTFIPYDNKNPIEIQNYIDFNNNNFKKIIKNSLKL